MEKKEYKPLQDRITEAQLLNTLTMWKAGCSHSNISECVGLSTTAVSRLTRPITMVREGKHPLEAIAYARSYGMERVIRRIFKLEGIEIPVEQPVELVEEPTDDDNQLSISGIKDKDNTAMCMTRIIGELHQLNKKLDTLIAELAKTKEEAERGPATE